MDIATLLGLVGAFGLIIWSMLQGGTLAAYSNIPGLAIVVGGSIMVVLLRSSLEEFLNAVKVAGKAFGKSLEKPDELISQLVEFASIARKDGMIALEGQEIDNPFMEKSDRYACRRSRGGDDHKITDSRHREYETQTQVGGRYI